MIILAIMILIGLHKYPEEKVNFANLNQTGNMKYIKFIITTIQISIIWWIMSVKTDKITEAKFQESAAK